MISQAFKILLLTTAIGFATTGIARADCEADLVALETAMAAPGLTPNQTAAYTDAAKTATSAMHKDDDATCKTVITEAIAKVTGKAAVAAAPAADTGASLGDLSAYRNIAADTLTIIGKGDMAAAAKRATDLETAWDAGAKSLKALNADKWTVLDDQLDVVFKQIRAAKPDTKTSGDALQTLIGLIDASK